MEPSHKRVRVAFEPRPSPRNLATFVHEPAGLWADVLAFLGHLHPSLVDLLDGELERYQYKMNLALEVVMGKEEDPLTGEAKTATPCFRIKAVVVLSHSDIMERLPQAYATIEANVDKWVKNGSGWQVRRIKRVFVDLAKYEPLRGSSYFPLPPYLKRKKAIINVQNNDDQCLKWALLSAIHPVNQHTERVSKYAPYSEELDFAGVEFPGKLSDLGKVEKNNPGLSINVFGLEDGDKVHPLRLSKDAQNAINLMLLQEGGKTHWVWVRNFGRLCADRTRRDAHDHYCMRCLSAHNTTENLAKHLMNCSEFDVCRVNMPKPGEHLKFQGHHKQLKAPYVIYADCEALIRPLDTPQQCGVHTTRHSQHIACSVGYVVVRSDGVQTNSFFYRGEDAMEHFLTELEQEEELIRADLGVPAVMNLSPAEEQQFQQAVNCWICDQPLLEDRVRDHDHVSGDFRGAAHQACNLKLRICPATVSIPVVFHNLKGYDSHHIISAIGKTRTDTIEYTDDKGRVRTRDLGAVGVIPTNTEKYIAFTWRQYKFIDSLAFLNASLDRLVGSTAKDAFEHTAARYSDPAERELVLRKGVYPYEYMTDAGKFEDTSLPPQEAFFSTLSGTGITDADYAHAKNVWEVFGCRTLGDYHDLYLETDVLLLCDIFENFRKAAIGTYSLDPANYFTLPGFSWDALLKCSDVSLELLSDIDMHQFIERGMRGGVSMASQRYAKANNPHMAEYDATKPTTYLQYLDANNLYGWAMCQHLPVSAFKWQEPTEQLVQTILALPDDASTGYMLECDMVVPPEVHDALNDYPPSPEKLSVKPDMLSPYQQRLVEKLQVTGLGVPKLVPNLLPKQRYVLHYRNLQLYLGLGLKLAKVHRALSFTQSPWMRGYIMKNTELRKLAISTFEKDFYKLMNNAVFGKTMENVRKRINHTLIRAEDEEQRLLKAVAKTSYERSIIYDNDLVGVCYSKTQVTLCKPIYVGMTVLDLSKHLMFSFYHRTLKSRYGDNVALLYTDTDSLILEFKTADLYADMAGMAAQYDTSNFPVEHPLYSTTNKKVVGKFKDELGGKLLTEFIGLRSKLYAYDGEESGKRAKGVSRSVLRQTITVADYRSCLLEEAPCSRDMRALRSHGHHIYGESVHKSALSCFDSKRYIAEDGITTLAYGHHAIP